MDVEDGRKNGRLAPLLMVENALHALKARTRPDGLRATPNISDAKAIADFIGYLLLQSASLS